MSINTALRLGAHGRALNQVKTSAGTGQGWAALAFTPGQLAVAGVCFVVAFGLVLHDLAQPHGLYGLTEYDDGVYFASGLRLSEGFLPYKDFVLVQPPGMAVLMAPFGFLAHLIGSREALGAARVITGVVTGLNAALVAALLRHRGLFASATAGLLLAVFPPAWQADHTLMLEPWLVLFCLLGITLCFRGEALASPQRVLLGGVCFGIAGTVKTWAIVPVLVLLAVLVVARRDLVLRFCLGVALAFVVICLPFFAFAPHQFVTDVITSQLQRQTVVPTTLNVRLSAYTGLSFSTAGLARHPYGPASHWPEVAAGLLGATIVLGSVLPTLLQKPRTAVAPRSGGFASMTLGGRRSGLLEAYLLLAAIGTIAMTFVPQQFFTHYAYFTAPFLAAAVGFSAGRLRGLIARGLHLEQPRQGATVASFAVGLLILAIGLALVLPGEIAADRFLMGRFGDPGPAVDAVIPKGACVLTDAISLTISADRAQSNTPGCPPVIDPTGTWISYDPANPPQKLDHNPPPAALVQLWKGYFARAQYVVFSGNDPFRIPLAARAYLATHYKRVTGTHLNIYRRIGS